MKALWLPVVFVLMTGCTTRKGLKFEGGSQGNVSRGGSFAVTIRSQDGLKLSEATSAAVRDEVTRQLMQTGAFGSVDDGSPAYRIEITITDLSKVPPLMGTVLGAKTQVKGNVQVKDASGTVVRSFRAGADTNSGSFSGATRGFGEEVAKGATGTVPSTK